MLSSRIIFLTTILITVKWGEVGPVFNYIVPVISITVHYDITFNFINNNDIPYSIITGMFICKWS